MPLELQTGPLIFARTCQKCSAAPARLPHYTILSRVRPGGGGPLLRGNCFRTALAADVTLSKGIQLFTSSSPKLNPIIDWFEIRALACGKKSCHSCSQLGFIPRLLVLKKMSSTSNKLSRPKAFVKTLSLALTDSLKFVNDIVSAGMSS